MMAMTMKVTVHSGNCSAGRMTELASMTTQATTAYSAAVLVTFRRRNSSRNPLIECFYMIIFGVINGA